VADEKRISGENRFRHGRGLLIIEEQHTDGFRSMARSFEEAQGDLAHPNRVAIVNSNKLEPGRSPITEIDARAGTGSKFMMARDEISVKMRLDYVFDREPASVGFFKIDIDVALWINNGRFPIRSDQVRRVSKTAKIKLTKMHPQIVNGISW